ncbi:Transcriptional regulator, LysR family [uncultured Synechococcales cyanobacterium]|uniref:Transcriptional regulator, LysR family n=1 Tax=uncultured Synechococcales cyanobacterium TaxID=1936017 RepID=A0A6J4V6Q8_9CYAN|nr:Transcriptional regulator, LysR family [uncultured Synechococcales cyanobacterium]
MKRDELNDLAAFVIVADEMSFTRAASKLGMSPSALSHAMKVLEDRLGLQLLARTTRRVSTTEAGERLLKTLRPAFEDISAELTALAGLRDKPAGTLRITTPRHAATSVLWPMLPGFLSAYSDIRVEITIDEGLSDIIESRYDAGIRFGEKVAKDMVTVRVSSNIQVAIVASPSYFADHPVPNTPKDLAEHRCINYRFSTSGGLYLWEFEEGGRPFQVRVDGPLVFNDGDMILAAALAEQGIAYLFEDQIADYVVEGQLIRILTEWCPTFPGYYLYHPNRRQTPPALTALVNALQVVLQKSDETQNSIA